MQVTWTRGLWQTAAAAGLGAACFLWSAGDGLAQTTGTASSGASQTQPRSQAGQSASRTGQTGQSQTGESQTGQSQTGQSQSAQRTTDDDDDTQGVGRSQSGTQANRSGTSDYGQSSSQERSTQSGFGSTQTGRSRSDAQSGSEYNYGANPSSSGSRSDQYDSSQSRQSDGQRAGYSQRGASEAGVSGRSPLTGQSQDTWQDTRDTARDSYRDTRDSLRDTTRQAHDQFQDSRSSGREGFQQARDNFQDTRDSSRDAIGEARDDMRSTVRGARDQWQDSRSSRDEAQSGFARGGRSDESQTQGVARGQRDFSRDDDQSGQDFSRGASQREFSQRDSGQRDFSSQRDFGQRDQSQRDFSRDDQRGFARGQQRDDSDDSRQFSRDQRGRQRDFARDEDSERFQQDRSQQDRYQDSGRRDSWQEDRRSQSARLDQRDSQDDVRGTSRSSADFRSSTSASSRTQISRAADIGLWFDRSSRDGLIISDISSSGPITRFGFREGDQIISVNGTRVSSEQEFIEYLVSPRVMNQRVQVVVWREGQQQTIWVEPWVLVEETTVAQSDPLETYGVILDDRYSYPVVWRVIPRSPAYYAGIRQGDVIVAWSGQYVYNPDDLVTLVQQSPGDQIAVQISRNRQIRQLTLESSGTQSSRTALRPEFDQSFDARTDAIGAPSIDQGISTRTDTSWQQQGTFQGGAGLNQRTGTQLQSGATYGQATTGFGQQGAAIRGQAGTYGTGYGQTGAYGQAGIGTSGAYGQAGVGTPGTYGQAGGYVQPGMTGQQQGGVLRGGGILGGFRGR